MSNTVTVNIAVLITSTSDMNAELDYLGYQAVVPLFTVARSFYSRISNGKHKLSFEGVDYGHTGTGPNLGGTVQLPTWKYGIRKRCSARSRKLVFLAFASVVDSLSDNDFVSLIGEIWLLNHWPAFDCKGNIIPFE